MRAVMTFSIYVNRFLKKKIQARSKLENFARYANHLNALGPYLQAKLC